jgi:hypothetical protein
MAILKEFLIHLKKTRQVFMVKAFSEKEAKRMVFAQFGIGMHDWLDIQDIKQNLIIEMKTLNPGLQLSKVPKERN